MVSSSDQRLQMTLKNRGTFHCFSLATILDFCASDFKHLVEQPERMLEILQLFYTRGRKVSSKRAWIE